MTQDTSTYWAWIGGSCDYGHKERAGGAAVVIEQQQATCSNSAESQQKKIKGQQEENIISRDVIADLNTTEFRMMLTLMVKVMKELPEGSDIIFLTNAAYIQNFDKVPTPKSANPDLIEQCIEAKQRHNSVKVKIVQYHKSPLLIEAHNTSTEAMKKLRREQMMQRKQSKTCSNLAESQQGKTERQYNNRNKNVGMQNVLLFILTFGMTFITSCSSNNNKPASTTNKEQKQDTTISVSSPAPSETAEATETPILSIFDQLAKDMVCVETDTGNFYICKYEVTQKLWSEVMKSNPSEMQGDDLPVEQVNWDNCQAFISKLNELTGKAYRLPTEAEWEFACRGGKHSKGFKYSGSNELDEVAWYDENSDNKSHPVGQKKPNELGLYDMSGNVWEWCQDMHESLGMCRGGSWIHNARNCDPSLKNETPRSFYINSLGLRLAL